MNGAIENYAETASKYIKWKNYRHAVSEELKNHMHDSIDDLMGQGMTEEEALALTLQNMGDPHIIGEQLNGAYQPKCNKMLIFTVVFPVILFSLCEYFAVLEVTGNHFYLAEVLLRILAGGLGAFLLFYNNWAGDGRLHRFALKACISILVVCVILHFSAFSGKAEVINGMLILLPHLCCCCVDRVKEKKTAGLIVVMAVFAVPVFTAYYVQSYAGMILLATSGWICCMLTVKSGWLDIERKGCCYLFVSLPWLGILICLISIKIDNVLLNRKGFFVWEVIKGSVLCGRGRGDTAGYKSIVDYPAALITAKYGYIMLAAYVIFFVFLLFEIIKVYKRQQSFMARLMVISVLLDFIMECGFSLLLNLGVPLAKGITVPFLDFKFGIIVKLIQSGLVIKLDCFGNYIFSDYADSRLFDVEGGKIIIYYR